MSLFSQDITETSRGGPCHITSSPLFWLVLSSEPSGVPDCLWAVGRRYGVIARRGSSGFITTGQGSIPAPPAIDSTEHSYGLSTMWISVCALLHLIHLLKYSREQGMLGCWLWIMYIIEIIGISQCRTTRRRGGVFSDLEGVHLARCTLSCLLPGYLLNTSNIWHKYNHDYTTNNPNHKDNIFWQAILLLPLNLPETIDWLASIATVCYS